MTDIYRFKQLREMALKEQCGVPENLPEGEDGNRLVAEYVLISGDQKGQTAMAFDARGGGGSVEATFNPLGVLGINLAISAAGGFDRAKQRSVLVTVGPRQVSLYGRNHRENQQPYVLNSFIGYTNSLSVELGLEVSIGYSFMAGGFGGRKVETDEETGEKTTQNRGWQSQGESSNQFKKAEDEADESVMFELNCVGFEAKAGISGNVSYQRDWYYAEDPLPVQLAERHELVDHLAETLKEGSTKTVIKAKAFRFFNEQSHYFNYQDRNLHSSWFGMNFTKGFEETLRILNKYRGNINDPDHAALADELIEKLQRFGSPHAGDALLSLCTSTYEGELGAFANASASLFPVGDFNVSANALLGITGSRKQSQARYQTYWFVPTADGARQLMVTYDTVMRYSAFTAGLHAEISTGNKYTRKQIRGSDTRRDVVDDGYGRIYGWKVGGPMLPDVNAGMQKAGKWLDDKASKIRAEPESLNRMSYETSIVYWIKPFLDASQMYVNTVYDAYTNALLGTGMAIGQSFVIENLRKVIERHTKTLDLGYGGQAIVIQPSFHKDKYVKIIAQSLRVSTADLQIFFQSPEVFDYLSTEAGLPGEMSVLLEAGFRVNVGTSSYDAFQLPLKVKIDQYGNQVIQLAKDVGKKLGETSPKVESIRLRYRKFDLDQKQRNWFSLGFKFFGNEIKIKLRSISSAGSDGIIDLCTVFLDPHLRALHDRDPAAAYECAVPAAVLFCQ